MQPIPFFIKERQPVGSWNTPKLHEQFEFNAEIRNAWWYDFIPTIKDDEYNDLRPIFDKLDAADHSKTIEVDELVNIDINRGRLLNKDSMSVLQPEFEKFLQRIKEQTAKDTKVALGYSGKKKKDPLHMSKETCQKMVEAFAWINKDHLSLYEFLAMMQYIQMAICVFEINDVDHNSDMDPEEMVNAMSFFGYELSTKQTKALINSLGKKRIFSKEKKVHRTEFVAVCGVLASIRTKYQRNVLKGSKFAFDHKDFSAYLINEIERSNF